jgi:hypothetical protein
MSIAILIFNILGTFLVSVEAIKLENLTKTQKFLRFSNKNLNPEIPWEGSGKTNILNEIGCLGFLFRIFIIFCIPSFTLSYLYFTGVIEIYWIILIGIFGSYLLWTLLIILNEITIMILKSIVKYTEVGMIGLCGFVILVVSFVLQYKSSCP